MIDLHLHTSYSDGKDSVKELLTKCEDIGLETISITDHDNCSAYKELQNKETRALFSGNIIAGVEFATTYKGRLIELLAYGCNMENIDAFLNEYYCTQNLIKSRILQREMLLENASRLGLVFDENALPALDDSILTASSLQLRQLDYDKMFYREFIQHPENFSKTYENIFSSYGEFFRIGLTNPDSCFFVDKKIFHPHIKDILGLVHANGGKVFLAHAAKYSFPSMENFVNDLLDEHSLDGVECFYSSFSQEQSNALVRIVEERDLLMSGGSDYHGHSRPHYKLGVGQDNLNISHDILTDWNIDMNYEPQISMTT